MSIASFRPSSVIATRSHVAHSKFWERLAYARFRYSAYHGHEPGNAEIGRAVDRSGQAISAWDGRDLPPPDYIDGKPLHQPLADFLEVPKTWLIGGDGDPPDGDLWKYWQALRAHRRPSGAKQRKSRA